MAKVFLICGKLCSGKSTYAKQLQTAHQAVILSVDEIMLAVFGLYAGEKHDEYAASVRRYLHDFATKDIEEMHKTGYSVVEGYEEISFIFCGRTEKNIKKRYIFFLKQPIRIDFTAL